MLDVYQQSYDRLDAAAVATIWRGLDTRELARAFSTLSSQDLTFEQCHLAVSENRATANCRGHVSYVPRVGAPTRRTRRLTWVFELSLTEGRWLIERVTASEAR